MFVECHATRSKGKGGYLMYFQAGCPYPDGKPYGNIKQSENTGKQVAVSIPLGVIITHTGMVIPVVAFSNNKC